jgi:hypothetical protein
VLTDQDVVTGMIVRIAEVAALELTPEERKLRKYSLAKITKVEACVMCKCNHYQAVFLDKPNKIVGKNLGLNAKAMIRANGRKTRRL